MGNDGINTNITKSFPNSNTILPTQQTESKATKMNLSKQNDMKVQQTNKNATMETTSK